MTCSSVTVANNAHNKRILCWIYLATRHLMRFRIRVQVAGLLVILNQVITTYQSCSLDSEHEHPGEIDFTHTRVKTQRTRLTVF